jgi:hypothetical protein
MRGVNPGLNPGFGVLRYGPRANKEVEELNTWYILLMVSISFKIRLYIR